MKINDNLNLEESENKLTNLDIFTKENIERIRHINDLLKKEEERVFPFALRLHASLKQSLKQKEIDDYNFTSRLEVFSLNEACNKRHNTEEGNPIYEESTGLFEKGLDKNDSFYTDNWNFYCKGYHPLANIPFCYSMHSITSHSDLSWQDILDIQFVWIELKVDYQFMEGFKREVDI